MVRHVNILILKLNFYISKAFYLVCLGHLNSQLKCKHIGELLVIMIECDRGCWVRRKGCL